MSRTKEKFLNSPYKIGVIIFSFLLNISYILCQNEINLNEIDSRENDNNNNNNYENYKITELTNLTIIGEKVLRYNDSPFILKNDLDIELGAKLIIEPGVTIYFAPMIGITIRGSIQAIGLPNKRIILTAQPNADYNDYLIPEPQKLGARLVDGPTPLEGRLQIYYKGKWRSVCTNSRNWTVQDYETTCRQMGYKGGRFWNWLDRNWNFESRLLYEEPNCNGIEKTLYDCAWNTRKLGSGVCDYHNDIGIQCLPQHNIKLLHWKGLKFLNAPAKQILELDNTIYRAESLSKLKYVNIIRPGNGQNLQTTSGIEVIGTPPILENVNVLESAFTGINITRPYSAFKLNEIIVRHSKGYGIFINSSYGLANCYKCNISENGYDGIRYIGHDLRSNERNDRINIYDFCTLPTTAGQTYPISILLKQNYYSGILKECEKYFFTKSGYILTIDFVDFTINKNETAIIEIYDGLTINDRNLLKWKIRNSTRVQSISSTSEKIFIKFLTKPYTELLGYIRITSGLKKSYDLNITDSNIIDNNGRGIAIDNLRSQIYIENSLILGNGYTAGLKINNGAGDINITNSKISFNNGDGINITYYGGNRNISKSSLSSNKGYGIVIWLNKTNELDRQEFLPLNQTTIIEYSEIYGNLETGIQHGNFCDNIWINITGNHFNNSLSGDINIKTCWEILINEKKLYLQIGHNLFEYGNIGSIEIKPALNIYGIIEYNNFRYYKYGTLLIYNQKFEEFLQLPAKLIIQYNNFYKNQGSYIISLGLSIYSDYDIQTILFTRNFIRDNYAYEPFNQLIDNNENYLNQRSCISAVIVITSDNIDIYRNIISNQKSKYEIGSQLTDQSKIINATYNWLGYTNEEKIFSRLFHRNDRYNLAKIKYIPYLLHNSNPSTSTIITYSTYIPKFYNDNSEYIGGEIDGLEILPSGTYIVDRDINIRPGGKLILEANIILNFETNVGMMVAGKLDARGRYPNDILMTLKRPKTILLDSNNTNIDNNDMELIEIDTEKSFDLNINIPKIPIRLIGGNNNYEGRLQVYINGIWGNVCDYNWRIKNSELVCHQLGYTLNPYNWRLKYNEMPDYGINDNIILTNVQCNENDIDLLKCRSERLDNYDFENSCTHDNDIGIRCSRNGWAGIRFSVLAERSDLQYITIEKAGLFDYSINSFKPALQIDLAHHNIDNLRIIDNLNDGLGIIYSDIYNLNNVNNLKNSEIQRNLGNGISLKQLGLKISNTIIKDNLGAGILHNPVITALEQRELSGWFYMDKEFNTIDINYKPILLPSNNIKIIDLDNINPVYIITEKQYNNPIELKIIINCQPGYVIGIQLLNPIENRSTESIKLIDTINLNNKNSNIWFIENDLNIFPVTSSSYSLIMIYNSGIRSYGGTVLMLSTIEAPKQNILNKIISGPIPTLLIRSTKIQKNQYGLLAKYYNRYLGNMGEHYLRKTNETIKLINTEIIDNKNEAIFIYTPYWDVHLDRLSEITILINNSKIINNGYGIRQYSKDLRSSNNLYHYILYDNIISDNLNDGFDITLPYVWQYNENFTHSIFIENTTWLNNKKFKLKISGHYSSINITSNLFKNNDCKKNGLINIFGMEKKLQINYNKIYDNNCKFIFKFEADSLSEIMGEVPAIMYFNEIKNNYYIKSLNILKELNNLKYYTILEPSGVIIFKGIQKVKILRNLITNNSLDYDLIAGIKTAKLNNYLYASENWWGTTDNNLIIKRIFDFDDWNNYAEVIYLPYLLENSYDSSISISFNKNLNFDINNIGGRIYNDIILEKRNTPYIIKSDITIMPNVKMIIKPGVIMEFNKNIGILVLGTIIAQGFSDSEIIMRPYIKEINNNDQKYIEKRSIENMINYDTIRLCTNYNCTTTNNNNNNNDDIITEGFLEYFNHTTLQWIPICDRRFTERNAQVICRELGFNPYDIYYGHDYRFKYYKNSLQNIWSWIEPKECNGNEENFNKCPERLNGQLYGHTHKCNWYNKFVFISCNHNYNKNEIYWGGIRFAGKDFEQNFYENRLHDIHTHQILHKSESYLEYIRIENAGILHNEKSPAIQAIYKNPKIQSVTINNCLYHGINLIATSDAINLRYIKINNTLGNGINILSITGEGRESDESSYQPLKSLDLPYQIFSMLDICDTTKEIIIEERILLYYKYDNNPINCIKIFNTAYNIKPIGFRLLQSNLFNHSKEYGRKDAIHLYDGDIYNITSKLIGKIETDTENERKLFYTNGPILSVRLIASGAPATNGFIAEIVTIPISVIGFNRDAHHNISYSEISGAVSGAISYSTAGEVSPILTLEGNRFINNCRQLYGNFSTCNAAIDIDVQNMQSFYFRNNLVQRNQGGLRLRADSRGSATSLRGWIHNNLITNNRNRPVLQIEGRQSSPYQEVTIFKNYITQNNAGYKDVINLRQVVSNFTYNYVHSNIGGRILEISGFDKVRLPIYQTTSHNGFYNNFATDWSGRATVVAGTAGQHYVDNIFNNPDNDYEMITVNRSITIDLWKSKIDASHNYWSYNETISVGSRIKDQSDDNLLLEVQYIPYHMNNLTILDGKCPPGWSLVLDSCYLYVGGPMTFNEARDFCRSDNASMPFVRTFGDTLWLYLQREMQHLRYPEKVWVQDFNYIDRCTSFIYSGVEIESCDIKLAFICEIDPKVVIDPLSWKADIFAVGIITAFILALILLGLVAFCWYAKSRHRNTQRLERRNSIRQSLRSLNSIDGGQGSIRRRNFNMSSSTNTLTKSTATDYKKMMSNGSIDSMDKSVLSSETNYEIYEAHNPNIEEYTSHPNGFNELTKDMYNDYTNQNKQKLPLNITTRTATVGTARTAGKPRNYPLPQGFELSYRNEGFRDNSTFSGTRNNSLSTNLTEDLPIINQTDNEDTGSDYYGNSSTLPLRSKNDENLSFLTELKQRLPEYETASQTSKTPSSFLPSPIPPALSNLSEHSLNSNTLSYGKKIDALNFTPIDNDLKEAEIRKTYHPIPIDMRRPDSYYTAMKSSRAPMKLPDPPTPPMEICKKKHISKAVYQSANDQRQPYQRSKSEALLETNFDENESQLIPLQDDNRSYSQPLETAM